MTDIERALSREINAAMRKLALARKLATRTNDSDVRIHYCESWLSSLMNVARALP